MSGSPKHGDGFGTAVAAANFGSTAHDDLAIGVPGKGDRSGILAVVYGADNGLTTVGNERWSQDSEKIPGGTEPGDRFGTALTAGDLGGTSQADLAIRVSR